MGRLSSDDLIVLFLGLAAMLASAHLLGEAARRLRQPAVIGEMLAGLLLGRGGLGAVAPAAQQWLFPHGTPAAVARDALVALSVALFLLVAGLEVDVAAAWRHGRAGLAVALAGLLVPLALGSLAVGAAPGWWGLPPGTELGLFAVAVGAALAVSALPVIARILYDLNLLQTDLGVRVLVAATLNNLLAWLIFAVVLGGRTGHRAVLVTVVLTVGLVVLVLTLGRWAADRALPWVQAHLAWPGGVLGFLLITGLVGAAVTEAIGVPAIFGSFLAGMALGSSAHLREHTRQIVSRFVEGVFAPIFVVAIGLEVDLVAHFVPGLVLGVLALGMLTKILACALAARLGGLRGPEVWATGWAMNARGELGIVVALLGWQAGVFRERLFVALVVLAVVTSALAGPAMKRLLRRGRTWSLAAVLDGGLCLMDLDAGDAADAIRRLAAAAAGRVGLSAAAVAEAVLRREAVMGTGIGHGVAVPHARLAQLKAPLVAAGRLRRELDFNAADGEPVRLVFLVLTPVSDAGAHVQILASIARLVRDPQHRQEALAARTPTALLAALRVADVLQK